MTKFGQNAKASASRYLLSTCCMPHCSGYQTNREGQQKGLMHGAYTLAVRQTRKQINKQTNDMQGDGEKLEQTN